MRKVIPKNIADEMTKPYIDDAVEKQIEAADVPPRNKLNISFENAGRIDDNKEYKSNQEAYEKNHGKLYDMTHKNTIPWRNYVVYLVLISLLTTVFTFSKYMSGATGSGTGVVAKFSYSVDCDVPGVTMTSDNTFNNSPTIDLGEGNGVTYSFTVNNSSDVRVLVDLTSNNPEGFKISVSDGFELSPNNSGTFDVMIVPDTDSEIDAGTLNLNFAIEQVD